jgi:hypothetical protein
VTADRNTGQEAACEWCRGSKILTIPNGVGPDIPQTYTDIRCPECGVDHAVVTDHADVIREALPALHQLGPTCRCKSCAAHAAVSALVAERDEARRDVLALRLNAEQWREQQTVLDRAVETVEEMADKIVQLEAEVARLRREIHDTATWLSIWSEQGEDHPRAIILRAALAKEDTDD